MTFCLSNVTAVTKSIASIIDRTPATSVRKLGARNASLWSVLCVSNPSDCQVMTMFTKLLKDTVDRGPAILPTTSEYGTDHVAQLIAAMLG